MAFTLIQAGSTLQFVDSDGAITTLTLPTGTTLNSSVPPRWVVYGNYVVLVNTPSYPVTVDATGTVRPLTPKAPRTGPIASAGDAGALSGTYAGIRYSFIIKDINGRLISESDLSPASNSVTITSKQLKITGIETSSEPITARRLYRPTTNGTILFPWLDLDGNILTQVQDDLSDAGLEIIAAPTLGNPPHLTHIKEWRNRLWGVSDTDRDTLRYAQADAMWSWPAVNGITVPGIGRDQFGIRALMPRRESLGVGRRDIIWQVVGETPDDFRTIKLSEITGVESQESVVTYRDTIWWLWKDGVYQWDGDGIMNVSDGKVKSWFSTGNFFNQDMFQFSFAVFDPTRLKYKLYLASAGSTVIDRWVEYDVSTKTWWGPHKTDAFSPTSAFLFSDDADKVSAIVGSRDAYIWQENLLATDHQVTPIELDILTKFYDANMPDYEKYFGELSLLGRAQTLGTMQVIPTVGYLDATPQTPIVYDMTEGRQKLPRLGVGKLLQLNFKHATSGEPIEIYGFEVPIAVIGRR